jgi:hypothetical protein
VQAIPRETALPETQLDQRSLAGEHLARESRLYSPAIARLTVLTMVEAMLPSFSNCSPQ